MAFNTTEQALPSLDSATVHRQPRYGYIPLFGLLLANLLSNTVLAKYPPLGAIRLSYEPVQLVQRPNPQITHDNYNYWDPTNNPYIPPGTSESPNAQHIHHHHLIPASNQQQIVNINERPPTEILIGDTDTESTDQNETTSPVILTEEVPLLPMLRNDVEKPNDVEPVAAESRALPLQLLSFLANTTTPSSKKVKRGTSAYTKTRKNNKYISQKKRRPTTTTTDYYYDSIEEQEEETTTTKRYAPKRKVSQQRRPIVDSYEESESSISNTYSDLGGESQEYEYESYELTTKPQKKRRRTTTTTTTSTHRPKRYRNKYKVRKPLKVPNLDDYEEFEYDTESIAPSTTTTESLKIRHQALLLRQQEQLQRQQEHLQRQQEVLQRQQQKPITEEPTTTTTTTTTATPPVTTTSETTPITPTVITMILQGNVSAPDNTTGNNTGGGYGYGPSNGYESISITYSPSGVGSGSNSPVYVPPSPVYTNPSNTYGVPNPTYGAPRPTYSPPGPSYGPPSSSYGPPSNTYDTPSTSSGFSPSVNGYYQVPFNDWYSNEVSRNSIVKKVHDIIGFDNVFQ